jgi:hypothetical protein
MAAGASRLVSPTASSASRESVSRYFATMFGSKFGVARSGPCPVAHAEGSFWAIVSHGCTSIVTWMSSCVALNSSMRASYAPRSPPVKPVHMVSSTGPSVVVAGALHPASVSAATAAAAITGAILLIGMLSFGLYETCVSLDERRPSRCAP